ncbi:RRXRR domain-containing protein [Methylomonas rapida]|uniref:RRXRR domain-containing protein n=1 Tax=Methylomonas rapida TaxID=2963939 RepID=A0ABY7GDE8_9GAMM|nr:RRXRR domain-containing protein [Methylomonas rapida]WAR43312.1 RRXRR domain-containing protein [Methylomonas rapida]WAR43546.1 RRXRR domain-containing protein [Methylomonas rapida]
MTGSSIDTENAAGNRRPCPSAKATRSVKVQAANGQPINPCHPARARQLKRKKRAVRVCRHPFTIRLHPECPAEALQQLYEEDKAL